jgi:hypothetical protein
LAVLCLTLVGYALAGKGCAYVGVPPLFLGELVLLCGLLWVALCGSARGLMELPAGRCLLLLLLWGLVRLWPDVPRHGADALRDAVIWGYGVFAVLVFAVLRAQPAALAALLRRYRQFAMVFLACAPVIWVAVRIYPRPAIPNWPWADAQILHPKGGDVMVQAAGILAFSVSGLGGAVRRRWVLLLALLVGLVGTYDRAGLLSLLAVFGLCCCLRPRDVTLGRLLALGLCGLAILAVTGVRVAIPGREREVSVEQLTANLASLVGATRAGDLDETKEWRLEWWGDIYEYTVAGKYCWDGKGFGVNLADDDGYQVEEDGSLRCPHNGHMTVLARGGVPGLAVWALAHLVWAGGVLAAYLRSRRAGEQRWAGLFLFLLAYWLAFMVNTSFDVFLEGPMGGIWYWSVYGVGLAALWLYRHSPGVLDELPCEGAPVPLGGGRR